MMDGLSSNHSEEFTSATLANPRDLRCFNGRRLGYAINVALNVIVPHPEKEMGMGCRKMDERRWITMPAGLVDMAI